MPRAVLVTHSLELGELGGGGVVKDDGEGQVRVVAVLEQPQCVDTRRDPARAEVDGLVRLALTSHGFW